EAIRVGRPPDVRAVTVHGECVVKEPRVAGMTNLRDVEVVGLPPARDLDEARQAWNQSVVEDAVVVAGNDGASEYEIIDPRRAPDHLADAIPADAARHD